MQKRFDIFLWQNRFFNVSLLISYSCILKLESICEGICANHAMFRLFWFDDSRFFEILSFSYLLFVYFETNEKVQNFLTTAASSLTFEWVFLCLEVAWSQLGPRSVGQALKQRKIWKLICKSCVHHYYLNDWKLAVILRIIQRSWYKIEVQNIFSNCSQISKIFFKTKTKSCQKSLSTLLKKAKLSWKYVKIQKYSHLIFSHIFIDLRPQAGDFIVEHGHYNHTANQRNDRKRRCNSTRQTHCIGHIDF